MVVYTEQTQNQGQALVRPLRRVPAHQIQIPFADHTKTDIGKSRKRRLNMLQQTNGNL